MPAPSIVRNRFEFINGGRIVAEHHTPGGNGIRPGRFVIVSKNHQIGGYVVAWQGIGYDGTWDGSWDNGNYCQTLKEANEVFADKLHSAASAPGIHVHQQYYCQDCDPSHPDGAYVLVAQGQKCESCPRIVDDKGEWHKRDAIDAMKEAVRP
jgi:hypothetical protein